MGNTFFLGGGSVAEGCLLRGTTAVRVTFATEEGRLRGATAVRDTLAGLELGAKMSHSTLCRLATCFLEVKRRNVSLFHSLYPAISSTLLSPLPP